ncbi:hypothetical protein BDR22DRAFT_976891 [Usnea florida]
MVSGKSRKVGAEERFQETQDVRLTAYRSKSAEPAREALDSRLAFDQNVSRLVPREARVSATIDSKQDALILTQYESANTELDLAQVKNSAWSAKRKKGLRKLPTLLQTFMTRFADFLEAYSVIVEIIKQADSQYGGLAYSTVSLLLLVGADMSRSTGFSLSSKVAVNKSKREETIDSTLESLRWVLPRVGKLQGLIPSDDSALLVNRVYTNVVKFARSCILYYSSNSVERVSTDIIGPPKLYMTKKLKGFIVTWQRS